MIFFNHILLTFTILNVADWFKPVTSDVTLQEMRGLCIEMVKKFTQYQGAANDYSSLMGDIDLVNGNITFPRNSGIQGIIIYLPRDVQILHKDFSIANGGLQWINGQIVLMRDVQLTEALISFSKRIVSSENRYKFVKQSLDDYKAYIQKWTGTGSVGAAQDFLQQYINSIRQKVGITVVTPYAMTYGIMNVRDSYSKYLVIQYFSTKLLFINPLQSYCESKIENTNTEFFKKMLG
jgi:hypothetical protein